MRPGGRTLGAAGSTGRRTTAPPGRTTIDEDEENTMPGLDDLKGGATEKVSDAGIDKAGDAVDAKAAGHEGQVDKAQTMADGKIGE